MTNFTTLAFPIVAYWARMYSLQLGIKASKQPDEKAFLVNIMDWLETTKKTHKDDERVTNETVAQAYLENYALKLFTYADQQDRAANFGKNVVKAFYTSAMIYDIITTFGELSVEASQCRKYAKWKAAYIHNCLKNGETPQAGPLQGEGENEWPEEGAVGGSPVPNSAGGWNTAPVQPYPPLQPTQPQYQPLQPTQYQPDPQAPSSNTGLPFHLPDPPREPEPKHPGGFIPYNPQTSNLPSYDPAPAATPGAISPELIAKAQKLCKYAQSALTYEDAPTAIANLEKCLRLLKTGQE